MIIDRHASGGCKPLSRHTTVVARHRYKTVVASFWFDHQTCVCIGHTNVCRAVFCVRLCML